MSIFAIPRKTLPTAPIGTAPAFDPRVAHAVIKQPGDRWLAVGPGVGAAPTVGPDELGEPFEYPQIRRVMGWWRTSMFNNTPMEHRRPTGSMPSALRRVVFAGTPEDPWLVTRNGHIATLSAEDSDFTVQHLRTSRVWEFNGRRGIVLRSPENTAWLRVFTWTQLLVVAPAKIEVFDINPELDTPIPVGEIPIGLPDSPNAGSSYQLRCFPWWPDQIVIVYPDTLPEEADPIIEVEDEEEHDATQMLGPFIQLPKGSTATRTRMTDGYWDLAPDEVAFYWRDSDPDPAVVAANPDVLPMPPELATTWESTYDIKSKPQCIVVDRYNDNLVLQSRTHIVRGWDNTWTAKTPAGHVVETNSSSFEIALHSATAFERAGFYNDSGDVIMEANTRRYDTRATFGRFRNYASQSISTQSGPIVLPGDRSSEDHYWIDLLSYRTLMSDTGGRALLNKPLHDTTNAASLPRPVRVWIVRVFDTRLPEPWSWQDTGIRVVPLVGGGGAYAWGTWSGPPPGYEGLNESNFSFTLEGPGNGAPVLTRVNPGKAPPTSLNPFASDRLDLEAYEILIPPSKWERVLAVRSHIAAGTVPSTQVFTRQIGGRDSQTTVSWSPEESAGHFLRGVQGRLVRAGGTLVYHAIARPNGQVRLGAAQATLPGTTFGTSVQDQGRVFYTPNRGRSRDTAQSFFSIPENGQLQGQATIGVSSFTNSITGTTFEASGTPVFGVEPQPHGFWSDGGGWRVWRNGVGHDTP